MIIKSKLSCPKCLHENPSDAFKCSLCDCSLQTKDSDETCLPEEHESTFNLMQNTAENLEIHENEN